MNKAILTLVLLTGFLSGCVENKSIHVINQIESTDDVWAFVHYNVPLKEGVEDYFHFGRINRAVYAQVVNGERTDGFVVLRDVRYIADDDSIQKYEDNFERGEISFRARHIEKIEIEKGDPLELYNPADDSNQG